MSRQQKSQPQKQSPISKAVQGAIQQPIQNQQFQVQQVQQVQTIFDPEVVRKYSEMVPDAPQRILTVLENNNAAEIKFREMQAESVNAANSFQAQDNSRRDWMAFIIIIFAILLSALFSYQGHIWLTGFTLTGLAGIVVNGYLIKHKESSKK